MTAEGFTLNEEHFKNDAEFSNLQGDVLVFQGVDIDEEVTQTISTAYETCFNTMTDGAFRPVLTSKQMQATKEQGAGEIAREALCQVSPAVKTVLSLALAETMFTKQKRKQLEDILGVVGKPVKKAKSGTGHEKPVDTVPYHSLLYGCQDLLQRIQLNL